MCRLFVVTLVLFELTVGVSGAEFQRPERQSFHLFVLAGQSNMAGRGEVDEAGRTPHKRIWMLNKAGNWTPAVDPIHFDKPTVVGVGPGRSFALAYAEAHPDATIGLIPCAVGGSPIAAWRPGGYHASTQTHPWDDAAKRVRLVLEQGSLKGVLWHQGESDAKPDLSAVYERELDAVVAQFRTLCADSQLPFVAGQMGQFAERPWDDAKRRVDTVHRSLSTRLKHTAFASSDGLTHKGDEIHFDTPSARTLGRRYFEAFQSLVVP